MTHPDFLKTKKTVRAEQAEAVATQKMLSGWSINDVLDYLQDLGFSYEAARKITVRAYNRVTNPLIKGKSNPTLDA